VLQDLKEHKESKEYKGLKEYQDPKEHEDSKEQKDLKVPPVGPRDPKDLKVNLGQREQWGHKV
jgi:hypothetical protein